jgi:hypothetical protein
MPLEIELLIAAWDNAKKNLFVEEDMEIDPETGAIGPVDGWFRTKVAIDTRADIVGELDDMMSELVAHYRETADDDESLAEVNF